MPDYNTVSQREFYNEKNISDHLHMPLQKYISLVSEEDLHAHCIYAHVHVYVCTIETYHPTVFLLLYSLACCCHYYRLQQG